MSNTDGVVLEKNHIEMFDMIIETNRISLTIASKHRNRIRTCKIFYFSRLYMDVRFQICLRIRIMMPHCQSDLRQ